jgi:glucokinase
MAYALGIDLGGTKVLASVIDSDSGEMLSTIIRPTHAEYGPDDVLARMLTVAQDALQQSRIGQPELRAVGIGAAGQIDAVNGVLIRAPNLPDELIGIPLAEIVRERLGVHVWLFNDVVSAAAGEAGFGAGRSQPDFVCVFVGTGIGGALYQNGRQYGGATNTAGEVGHMVIAYDGRVCGCGGRGHLEAYASRSAIVRGILAALRQGRDSVLRELEPEPDPLHAGHVSIHDVDIARAIEQGDALACEMVENGARYMAAGLASIINCFNPPLIILGGGMVEKVPLFFDLVVRYTRQDALLVPASQVEIVRAQLHDNAGVVGAALLAVDRQRQSDI